MSLIRLCLVLLSPVLVNLAPGRLAAATAQPETTRLEWKRSANGAIQVTSNKGPRLKEAGAVLQKVADRLDCLRMVKRHVRWSRLTWSEGRIQGFAVADSAIYGNVALLAMRDLLPGRQTAGSGVQQIRTRGEPAFRVRILVSTPRRSKPIRLSPPKTGTP